MNSEVRLGEIEVSQEKILKSLTNLGFKKAEARIYFYLAKRGPKKANEITNAIGMTKQQLYPLLKKLQNKAIINSSLDYPAKFSAVPFEKVLDLFAKVKIEEAKTIQKNKEKILSDWQSIDIPKIKENTANFNVIKGRNYIYSKIQQMIIETRNHFSAISNLSDIFRAEQFGVLDTIQNHPMKSMIQFRLITDIINHNLRPLKSLIKNLNPKLSLKARNPDIGISLFPRMIIRDNEEILYFISSRTDQTEAQDNYVALFTNCTSLVKPFADVFEDLWSYSTDIKQKINEIETGKPSPKTFIIKDAEKAKTKYDEVMRLARNEVFLVTSSEGIIALNKKIHMLKNFYKNGVSLKVMAPITHENLEIALSLSKQHEIRHTPSSYLGTTIIDGKHIFQFKHPKLNESHNGIQLFENTFYSNDFEYIEKTKNMLNDVWKNSRIPSAITLQSILEHSTLQKTSKDASLNELDPNRILMMGYVKGLKFKPPRVITEKDVLEKINRAPIYPEVRDPLTNAVIMCSVTGSAIIHPPDHLKLPDIMIRAIHMHPNLRISKQSTYGDEDVLIIFSCEKNAKLLDYKPVAIVGIRANAWKRAYQGTPAEQNIQNLKKNELQIQVHGNTFFAGWTVPISLSNKKISIPPSAIILEAYGKIKTGSFSMSMPSGYKYEGRYNGFNAFVTFIQNEFKYVGPGTDGLFLRDAYIEISRP